MCKHACTSVQEASSLVSQIITHSLADSVKGPTSFLADWEDMYHIWDHTFQSALALDPAQRENKIMLTNPPLNPTQNRMKLMETMFERYGFSGLSIQVQAGLTLYAQGNASCHIQP